MLTINDKYEYKFFETKNKDNLKRRFKNSKWFLKWRFVMKNVFFVVNAQWKSLPKIVSKKLKKKNGKACNINVNLRKMQYKLA